MSRRVARATTRAMLIAGVAASIALTGCEFTMSDDARITRAEQALRDGDSGAAVVDLMNVLRKDSANARARLLLARAELDAGNLSAASGDFEKVDRTRVDAEEYANLRWRLALEKRDYAAVVAGLAKPTADVPEARRLALLGRAQAGLGGYADARGTLERALDADPAAGDVRVALARVHVAVGDVAAAQRVLDRAIADLPGDGRVRTMQGELHALASRWAEAEVAYRLAMERLDPKRALPDYLRATSGYADVLLAQSKIDAAAALSKTLDANAPNSAVALLLGGRVAAARRDFPAALDRLQKLLNADPQNAPLRTMVAGIQFEQGAREQAAANLQQVLAADPANEPARLLLAQVQLAQGKADEAQSTLDTELDGTSPATLLLRARAALASGDRPRALAALDRLQSSDLAASPLRPDVAATYLQAGRADRALELLGAPAASDDDRTQQLRLLATTSRDRAAGMKALRAYATDAGRDVPKVTFAAATLSLLGENQSARELLQELVAAEPASPEARVALARVDARLGRLDDAEKSLREAVRLQPNGTNHLALAELALARGREPDALDWLQRGRTVDAKSEPLRLVLARVYLARNALTEAQAVADELVRLRPEAVQSRLLAATVAVRRKDASRAVAEATAATQSAPASPLAWLGRGEIHEQLSQVEDARAAYRRAVSMAPAAIAPAIALARLELAAGNGDAALAAARRLRDQPAARVAGLRVEGDVLARLRRPTEAVTAYEQVQAADPSAATAVALYRARLAAKAGGAESVLVSWLQTHPKDVAVRATLAEHWQRAGDRTRAIREYEAALDVRPDDPVILNNLAWLLHESGDARALELARRARALAPRNPAVADTLGMILVAGNDVDEGISLLREAAAGASGSADIRYHLAEALARKGANAEARQIAAAIAKDARASAEVRAKSEALAQRLR